MLNDITLEQVVEGLTAILKEAQEQIGVVFEINDDTSPLVIFKSDVLVTLIGRLEDALNVQIPENCYPFFDKEKMEQLTVRQAAEIIFNKASNI